MFVRQLIGRQAGLIIEMPFAEAKANVDAGTAQRVTDEEIEAAGNQVEDFGSDITPEKLLAGYRLEPAASGGFELYDAGGVKLSEEPFHNQIAAQDAAMAFSRRARGMPDGNGGTKTSVTETVVEEVDYETFTVEQLREQADARKLDSSKAGKKADWIKLLERDDKVKAALAAGEFEALHVDELKDIAFAQGIDLGEAKAKPDIVAIVSKRYVAPQA